ncbi:thiol:disulfide interchange protein DsbA/DsbL [Shewanella sp. VB17]|uniref:thiol:disulfide interchange protein DsbA/DsbL n=1 Tax=Shewanella sp. VB17 TaxID=2739432 RepID=UPI001563F601|nr:thiol:disulfide interchange protein DsbA/DsbL [Shewanella sp. VB17]NRD75630.1 thiol:disulfide interchange protein DsbA/DsbL [Shewanella sp. VB17]
MKKTLLMVAALLMSPMVALAADYKEGVHYTVINDGPATTKPEITEYFSFYCPHCFNFAKNEVPKIKAGLPEGVVFKQNHVDFIGGEMGKEMSYAFAVARQLKVDEKIEHALFSAIHEKKQHFTNRNDIRQLFIANGVEGKRFDAAVESFMVSAKVSQMEHATKDSKISGVPALIVNGKYRVETGAIKSYDELLDIAYYLTSMK